MKRIVAGSQKFFYYGIGKQDIPGLRCSGKYHFSIGINDTDKFPFFIGKTAVIVDKRSRHVNGKDAEQLFLC